MSLETKILEKFKRDSFFITQISSKYRVQLFYAFLIISNVLFCVVFQNLYLILMICRFVKEGAVVREMRSRFLTSLGLALCLNFGTLRYKTATQLNLELGHLYDSMVTEKIPFRKYPNAILFITIGNVYILITEILVSLSFVAWPSEGKNMRDRDTWVETICATGICDYGTLSEKEKNNWFYADLFLYTLSTVSSGVCVSIVYSFNCLSIICFFKSTFAALKLQCEDPEALLTREVLLKFREYCQAIKRVLGLCNDVFSGMFIIWFGVSLVSTCDFLSRALRNGDGHDPLRGALSFFIYGQAFISVIIVSSVSSKLPNTFNEASIDMQSLTLNRSRVSLDVFAELNILLSQIQSHPTGVEIGGCFLITKAFFVSYLGTIVTFLMIFYQFQSK